MLKISSAASSNIGKVKKVNEDNFYFNGVSMTGRENENSALISDSARRRIQFYAVFDGLDGDSVSASNPSHKFSLGADASLIAASALYTLQRYLKTKPEYDLGSCVATYAKNTNSQIRDYMRGKNACMGLSFAILCIDVGVLKAYNTGNCMIFLLRDNRLSRLSNNFSKVKQAAGYGSVPSNKQNQTVITQYLGQFENESEVEYFQSEPLNLKNGDKILLCTDGLYNSLSSDRLFQILSRDVSEQDIVSDLIVEALQNGGRDNITAIVVGVNFSDNPEQKRRLLQSSDGKTTLKPMKYRKALALKPEHIKHLIIAAAVIVLFIIAVTILLNVPPKPSDDPTGTSKSSDSATASQTQSSNPTTTQPTVSDTDDWPDITNTPSESESGGSSSSTSSSTQPSSSTSSTSTSTQPTSSTSSTSSSTKPTSSTSSTSTSTQPSSSTSSTSASTQSTFLSTQPTTEPTTAPTTAPTTQPTIDPPTETSTTPSTEPPSTSPTTSELPGIIIPTEGQPTVAQPY